LNNREAGIQIGKEARKTAEKFTWDYVADKTYDVYQQIIKEKHKSTNNA